MQATHVDSEQFWSIIQDCREASGGDMDRNDQLIKVAISRLDGKEAEAFYQVFRQKMDEAYTWALWGAAYVINGGCGDDTFSDFRASLISRGSAAYERAIADPDSLADEYIDPDAWFHEGIEYAVTEGAMVAIGKRPKRANPHPVTPIGTRWAEATVGDSFPRLVRKLGAA
jgi:hypothetical protein